MLILLDTNVLLRFAEVGHSQQQATADAIRLLHKEGHELVLVPQVLYEFGSLPPGRLIKTDGACPRARRMAN